MPTVIPVQKPSAARAIFTISKDAPDPRDYLYAQVVGQPTWRPPEFVDLSTQYGPALDQMKLGSCSANAFALALRYLRMTRYNDPVALSRLFIYFNERLIEGNVAADTGATLRSGIKALVTYGACPEALWPYLPTRYTLRPGPACYAAALKDRILSYHRVTSLDEYRHALASGYPVVLGMMAYKGLTAPETARTGLLPMPEAGEVPLGAHAVLGAGYDDRAQQVIVRNSWGASFGRAGNFLMPYAYFSNPNLIADAWALVA